jgi:hypothetical protein
MHIWRLSQDGRVNAHVKFDLIENLALKINAQVICLLISLLRLKWMILQDWLYCFLIH